MMELRLTGFLLALCSAFLWLPVQADSSNAVIELPRDCQLDCRSQFGVILGVSPSGVSAYSNCSSECVFPKPNFVDQVFTGIQWQCVEYARRWLLKNRGVVYGDVDIAADIWSLDYVVFPDSQNRVAFASIANGAESGNLKYGDLLIYASSYQGTGHVAVVTHVDWQQQYVEVVEQNYKNVAWSDKYARRIEFIVKDGRVWVLDTHLIGWKRVVSSLGSKEGG